MTKVRWASSQGVSVGAFKKGFLAYACFLFGVCSGEAPVDEKAFKEWINAHVTIGTSVPEALRNLQSVGFECVDITDQLHGSERGPGRTYECRRNVKRARDLFDRFFAVLLKTSEGNGEVREVQTAVYTDAL